MLITLCTRSLISAYAATCCFHSFRQKHLLCTCRSRKSDVWIVFPQISRITHIHCHSLCTALPGAASSFDESWGHTHCCQEERNLFVPGRRDSHPSLPCPRSHPASNAWHTPDPWVPGLSFLTGHLSHYLALQVVKSRPEGRLRHVQTSCPCVFCLHYLHWIGHSLSVCGLVCVTFPFVLRKAYAAFLPRTWSPAQGGNLGWDYSTLCIVQLGSWSKLLVWACYVGSGERWVLLEADSFHLL